MVKHLLHVLPGDRKGRHYISRADASQNVVEACLGDRCKPLRSPGYFTDPAPGGCVGGVGVSVGFVVGDGTGVSVAVAVGPGVGVPVGLDVGDGLGPVPPAMSRAIL